MSEQQAQSLPQSQAQEGSVDRTGMGTTEE